MKMKLFLMTLIVAFSVSVASAQSNNTTPPQKKECQKECCDKKDSKKECDKKKEGKECTKGQKECCNKEKK